MLCSEKKPTCTYLVFVISARRHQTSSQISLKDREQWQCVLIKEFKQIHLNLMALGLKKREDSYFSRQTRHTDIRLESLQQQLSMKIRRQRQQTFNYELLGSKFDGTRQMWYYYLAARWFVRWGGGAWTQTLFEWSSFKDSHLKYHVHQQSW